MDIQQKRVFWLNLLFRGSKSSGGRGEYDGTPDEYIGLFEQNNMTAINLPMLEFSYKNLDKLQRLLENLPQITDSEINGMIVTSPRVVQGLNLVLQQQADQQDNITSLLDERFVFVVGEKSAKKLEDLLGLGYNLDSTSTGSGKALADFIGTFCDNHRPYAARINLIYPKGNLSDEAIEERLKDSRIKLESVVIYETKINRSIESDIVERFKSLNIPDDQEKVIVNHIFFSPSGVDGFLKVGAKWNHDLVKECLPNRSVQFKYSAIGKTTEAALIRHGYEVFSVAKKPNATCLVEAVKDKMDMVQFLH